jgi:hypothetical protein
MGQFALATEDELSEAVGKRPIAEVNPSHEINLTFRRGGFGYLRANIRKFCEVARLQPVLLVTDLDMAECPAALLSEWTVRTGRPESLCLRVAVREVEAWLLADHDGLRELLGRRLGNLPDNPDYLRDPKRYLLGLASRAPREVRMDLLPEPGAIAIQGLGYNRRLVEFVQSTWSPREAAGRSESLQRAMSRLDQLSAAIQG